MPVGIRSDAFEDRLRDPARVFIEVGPGSTLATLVRQQPGSTKPTVVTSLRHPRDPKNDHAVIAEALGRLWVAGLSIDWKAYSAAEHRRRVELPTYPFERKRYWISAQAPSAPSSTGRAELADWFYVKSWTRSMPPMNGELPTETSATTVFDSTLITDMVLLSRLAT